MVGSLAGYFDCRVLRGDLLDRAGKVCEGVENLVGGWNNFTQCWCDVARSIIGVAGGAECDCSDICLGEIMGVFKEACGRTNGDDEQARGEWV